jgi:hypothetical protein
LPRLGPFDQRLILPLTAAGIVRSDDPDSSTALFVADSAAATHTSSVFCNVGEAGLGIGRENLLELFGVAGAGMVGAIPGGLVELTFAVWLIARGFAPTATVRSRVST